MKPEELTEHWK